jgi:hypothetical protein
MYAAGFDVVPMYAPSRGLMYTAPPGDDRERSESPEPADD